MLQYLIDQSHTFFTKNPSRPDRHLSDPSTSECKPKFTSEPSSFKIKQCGTCHTEVDVVEQTDVNLHKSVTDTVSYDS